ncbi:MAG: hypothetical protein IJE89_02480 [Bacilli bacterium]|nr:hypothetical protein [Bacilli bacterium]
MSASVSKTIDSILDDYYKCIGAFRNCEVVYEETQKIMNSYEKGSDEYRIAKGRQDDLLSNLGKVGEKALKYIISLELLRTNPNMSSIELDDFFRKKNTLKNFASRHGINLNDSRLEALLNYPDLNNQKGHNFDYWFSVLELTMPKVINTFKSLVYNSMQAESIQKYCEENGYGIGGDLATPWSRDSEIFYTHAIPLSLQTIISPGFMERLDEEDVKRIEGSKDNFFIKLLLDAERENIRNCGDVFTRLRYSANNPDKKSFSASKLYKTIGYFILLISLIHDNMDDLSIDVNTAFGKYQMILYKEKLGVSKNDIEKIFNNYVNTSWDMDKILTSRFSLAEIVKLIDLDVSMDELYYIIEESRLTPRTIEYYKSEGISDYNEMVRRLEKHLRPGIWAGSSKKEDD